jgi:hypothetical protein
MTGDFFVRLACALFNCPGKRKRRKVVTTSSIADPG